MAMIEQSPITQHARGIAAGKDVSEIQIDYHPDPDDLPESMQLGSHDRQTIDGFASRIKSLTDKLSQYATIKGDILVKKDDGTYDLGTFRIQDKSGTVTFSSDANDQITYKYPRHDQSYYGGFA